MEQYDSESICKHLLPIGTLSLVEVVDETLFIMDSMSTFYQIPLSSPQLRFYFLAAGGQAKSAIEWFVFLSFILCSRREIYSFM